MKRAPDNILQWNDLESYPAMTARPAWSRGKYIALGLVIAAIGAGVLIALSGVGAG